jgi:putative ABC transport system permease protein
LVRTFLALADSFWQDVRYALRNMFRNPGFTSIVVLCLVLGIGANTAMFSVINTVLLRPLPFKDADRLVSIRATPVPGHPEISSTPTTDAFEAIQADPTHFEDATFLEETSVTLTGADRPGLLTVCLVRTNFFQMLGVAPLVGRFPADDDADPARAPVVIISYAAWQQHFHADKQAMGKTVFLDSKPYTVIGVMPKLFDFPREVDLWSVLRAEDLARLDPHQQSLSVIAHLRSGTTLAHAQQILAQIGARLDHADPVVYQGPGLVAFSVAKGRVGRVQQTLWLLFVAVGLVLLIACANVANLLLARGWKRQKEFSIRAALGAGRARIARQLLVESVFVSLIGGLLGFALAAAGVGALRSIAPPDIPRVEQLGVDAKVFWFALVISLATGLFFGTFPAAQIAKRDLNLTLNGAAPPRERIRLGLAWPSARDLLTVSEVALCLVLLIGSVLVMRSLMSMIEVSPGFRLDHVLSLRVALPNQDKQKNNSDVPAFLRMLDQVRGVPGVEAASAKINPFLGGMGAFGDFYIGSASGEAAERGTQVRYILSEFFDVFRVPILRGRGFTSADDRSSTGIAIVNESFAKRYFPGKDPIGQPLFVPEYRGAPATTDQIVGLVTDMRDSAPTEPPVPTVFLPLAQNPFRTDMAFFMVRTALPPASATKSVEQAIWSVEKDAPVEEVETGEQLISDLLVEPKFHAALLSTFAGLGLVLALIGIFGVVSYSVGQRTREIGIRIALGAERGNILRLVLRGGMLPVLVGIAIGTAGALALTRLIQSFLYGVKPTDPLSFIAAAPVFCAVAILACYQPARRATRVDPLVALRHE